MNQPTLAREMLLKQISDNLTYLQICVENRNVLHLYDINIISENFFARLLSYTFKIKLKNLNKGKVQAGIDIGDHKAGICFQVTSDGSKSKIKDSISKFINDPIYKQYKQLKFLIIGRRQGKYEKMPLAAKVKFNPQTSIVSIKDLIGIIGNLSKISELNAIANILNKEMPGLKALSAISNQSDKEALAVYRSFFDRPALQDSWHGEGDYKAFGKAMDDLVALLNTGVVDGKAVTKRRSAFTNKKWRDSLETLYHTVRNLRQKYTLYVRSGEIDPLNNSCHFKNPNMMMAFDTYKQAVINEINYLLQLASMQPIQGVSQVHNP